LLNWPGGIYGTAACILNINFFSSKNNYKTNIILKRPDQEEELLLQVLGTLL